VKVPTLAHRALYRERRSQFHGVLYPGSSREEFSAYLNTVRKEYHEARHICWAYRLFTEGGVQEYASDAGEPPGTAGRPILNALQRGEVINGVLFVARIFGGVKLGRQGLRAAYGRTAELVLGGAKFKPWESQVPLVVQAPLAYYGVLGQVLERVGGRLRKDASGQEIYWEVEVPVRNGEYFRKLALERCRGQVEIKGWAGTTKPRR
jgi:putative IMPACT (imprinted ancient) family translation regulator